MANEIVEKNQRETHEEVVAKYIFECTGGGVTEPVRSPEKEALKPGIRLHFLRYGLFDKNADDENEEDVTAPVYENRGKQCNAVLLKEGVATYAKLKKETENTKDIEKLVTLSGVEVLNLKIMPKLKHFSTARTALNTGYIYLINDEDPNDYYELEIDETGLLQHVLWEYNKDAEGNYLDQREAAGDKVTYKLVQPGKKLWAAYSTKQWSRAYHHELNMDAEKRKKRMVLIDCSGIKKGAEQEHKHVIPFKDVRAVFPKGHPRAIPLQQMLHQIHADEKKQDEKGANEIFEDLFVTLHDPIGCANDIGEVLITKHRKHEALITSIQTGEDEALILDRLEKGEKRSEVFSKYEEQVGGLYATALNTYHLIYDSREKEKEYGDTTDKNKILKILAVKERKQKRKDIAKIRDDFGGMISSAYYNNHLPEYIEGGNQAVYEGKRVLLPHLEILSRHPHDKDRLIDLKKDYTGKSDPWKNFFKSILKGEGNISKLLIKPVKLEDVKQSILDSKKSFSLFQGVVSTFNSISETYAKYATSEVDFEVVLNYVKSVTYKGEVVIQVKRKELHSQIKKGFLLNVAKWLEEDVLSDYKKWHRILRIRTEIGADAISEITENKRLMVPIKGKGDKISNFITKVLNHPKFRAFVTSLELINTTVKMNELNKKTSGKNVIDMTGAVAGLVSAATGYAEVKMLANGFLRDGKPVKFVVGTSKITGFIGGGVGVLMSALDCIETFQSRDYDASIAWGITTALGAIVLVDGIVAFIIGSAVGFMALAPLGVLFLLALVGTGLAMYLTDPPLVKFFKNNVLGSEHVLPAGNEAPSKYIRKIYKNRTVLVEDDFIEMRDFKKMAELLYDLLISYRVTSKVEQFEYKDIAHQSIIGYIREGLELKAGIAYKKVKVVKIRIHLRKFLYNTSSFDFAMKLFFKGVEKPTNQDQMLLSYKEKVIKDDKTKADVLEVTYRIPDAIMDQISLSSELVFISRTIINRELKEYWPYSQKEARYMAYKLSATDWLKPALEQVVLNTLSDKIFGKHIKIGTEKEIFNSKIWK
ncbi:toxin VasX [Tenacibaculum maritimum]|uniref:toxin VasX n=3 Tax=Tenacibaculum maritimum TaxID=107401 RepID=UPI00388E92BB